MNNGGYFAVGFALGWATMQLIFNILKICWYGILSISILFWEGSKKFFNLFKRTGKKLYSSYKNRKTKTNTKE